MVYLIFWNHPDICMTCSFLWSISRFVGAGIRPMPGKCDKSLVAQKSGDLDLRKSCRGESCGEMAILPVSRCFWMLFHVIL